MKWCIRWGAKPCARQIRCTEETLMPTALPIAGDVQWVASCGGSVEVSVTTFVDHRLVERLDPRGPGLVAQEAVDAFLGEALLPPPNAGLRLLRPAHDLDSAVPVSGQKHDLSPPGVFLRGIAVAADRLQAVAISGSQRERNPWAHAPDSHAPKSIGIPLGIQMSGAIH